MTGDAFHVGFVFPCRPDARDNVLVTLQAGRLGNVEVPPGNLDLIWKMPGRKSERMKKAVDRLRSVLWNQAGRSVTVITNGNLTVARFHPAFILLPHHVAVGAGGRIVRHVRRTLCVTERKEPNSQHHAQQDSEQYRRGEPAV